MSTQYQRDAVMSVATPTLTNGTPVTCVTGNFMTSPFQTSKGTVRASLYYTQGTLQTSIRLQLFRNPSSENVLISDSGIMTQGVIASGLSEAVIEGTDPIPDGRSVQYALVVTCAGGGTNGSMTRAVIDAAILSG